MIFTSLPVCRYCGLRYSREDDGLEADDVDRAVFCTRHEIFDTGTEVCDLIHRHAAHSAEGNALVPYRAASGIEYVASPSKKTSPMLSKPLNNSWLIVVLDYKCD